MNKLFKIMLSFAVCVLLLLFIFSSIFDHVLKKDAFNKFNWVMSKENGAYDFAVLGSSRGACNIDVYTLENELIREGKKPEAINLSYSGSAFQELKTILESFLKKNSIKTLLLEVDVFGLDNRNFEHPYHAFNFFPYIGEENIWNDMKNNFGFKAYAWKYIPFYKYAEFNGISGMQGIISILQKKTSAYDDKGGCLIDSATHLFKNERDTLTIKGYNIDNERVNSLKQIIEISKKNNVNVIMYIAPEYIEAANFHVEKKNVLYFYTALAKDNGVSFYDLSREEMGKDQNYFVDPEHTNNRGAKEFTKIFAKVIRTSK